MLVFEKEPKNLYLDAYRNKRLALVQDDVLKMMKELNIEKVKNIFISTGDDETNIQIAMRFMELLDAKQNMIEKFIVHIEDRTLRNLYADDKALHKDNIDLRTFSFYKEAARQLFKEHPLDGDDCKIMQGNDAFHILIVGHSELTVSLISEACRLSNLPNENRLTIHCMGAEMQRLQKDVHYAFPQIEELKHVNIVYIEEDNRSVKFYEHPVWYKKNIKHIIYANSSVIENIRISTKVSELTYVRENKNVAKTKFHIATMNHVQVAEEINKEFEGKNIFTFAQADKICSRKNLLFNGTDYVAQMIHYAYESEHFRMNNPKMLQEAVRRAWREATVNDKRTSVAQAIHMDTKLKSLGLKRKKVRKEVKLFTEKRLFGLYRHNLKMLKSKIEADMNRLGLTQKVLNEMEEAYLNRKNGVNKAYFFPKDYETHYEKMLRMEHNRWMTILILMDNIYDKKAKDMPSKERKKVKIHHLLKPFEDFTSNEERIYVLNDMHTIKNLARYLALTGYVMVEFEEVKR